jgi:hypothetical protein
MESISGSRSVMVISSACAFTGKADPRPKVNNNNKRIKLTLLIALILLTVILSPPNSNSPISLRNKANTGLAFSTESRHQ